MTKHICKDSGIEFETKIDTDKIIDRIDSAIKLAQEIIEKMENILNSLSETTKSKLLEITQECPGMIVSCPSCDGTGKIIMFDPI